MARAPAKAKTEFEYIKGSVTLGAKGVTKIAKRPLTINDQEELHAWKKKKDIVLSLSMKFARVCDDDEEESEKKIKQKERE